MRPQPQAPPPTTIAPCIITDSSPHHVTLAPAPCTHAAALHRRTRHTQVFTADLCCWLDYVEAAGAASTRQPRPHLPPRQAGFAAPAATPRCAAEDQSAAVAQLHLLPGRCARMLAIGRGLLDYAVDRGWLACARTLAADLSRVSGRALRELALEEGPGEEGLPLLHLAVRSGSLPMVAEVALGWLQVRPPWSGPDPGFLLSNGGGRAGGQAGVRRHATLLCATGVRALCREHCSATWEWQRLHWAARTGMPPARPCPRLARPACGLRPACAAAAVCGTHAHAQPCPARYLLP